MIHWSRLARSTSRCHQLSNTCIDEYYGKRDARRELCQQIACDLEILSERSKRFTAVLRGRVWIKSGGKLALIALVKGDTHFKRIQHEFTIFMQQQTGLETETRI